MIIDLQIRNCTGTILFYRVIDPIENYHDYNIQVLPGMFPAKENKGFTSSDTYIKDVEMQRLMRWQPRLNIDQRSGTTRKVLSREQSQTGSIPCNMRKKIFINDINNKVQLFCIYKGRHYIATFDIAGILNFNILVGLIRKENIAFTTRKYNDSPDVIGNNIIPNLINNRADYNIYTEKFGDTGYIMYFDCCGNTLIINSHDNEYQAQGLQEVSLGIYRQFISDPHFSLPNYLATPAQMWNNRPSIYSRDIKPSITGSNIGLNYFPLVDYDLPNIDYMNRNYMYLNPAKEYTLR